MGAIVDRKLQVIAAQSFVATRKTGRNFFGHIVHAVATVAKNFFWGIQNDQRAMKSCLFKETVKAR